MGRRLIDGSVRASMVFYVPVLVTHSMKTHDTGTLAHLKRLYAENRQAFAFEGRATRDFEEWARWLPLALVDI